MADVARTLAMFGAFTEGMSLFASFAMLLNFPRHNKMNGMGQIVSWSVRDESLHCEGIISLYHEWHRETGAVTAAVRDDIVDVAQDHGRSGGELRRSRLRARHDRGHDRRGHPRLCPLRRRLAADAAPLPTVFGNFEETESGYRQLKAHPLPWLVEILNGVEHANFFEQRATEYSKAPAGSLGRRRRGLGGVRTIRGRAGGLSPPRLRGLDYHCIGLFLPGRSNGPGNGER